jgi:hypothetical protein
LVRITIDQADIRDADIIEFNKNPGIRDGGEK